MHVISVSDSGELLWVQAPNLVPGPAEILIDVKATAINRADLMPVSYTHLTLPTNREV